MTLRFLLRAFSAVSMHWLLAAFMFAQAPSAERAQGELLGVDGVIALVQANMSETLVMKRLKREGKTYDLTAAELVKLQKAGVPEKIIEFMMDPQEPSAPAQATPKPDPVAAAPAAEPAGEKKEAKRGFFGRIAAGVEERSRRFGQRTADSAERTADKTAASMEDKANQKVDASQAKVDQTVETKLGVVEQKTTGTPGQSSTQPTPQQSKKK